MAFSVNVGISHNADKAVYTHTSTLPVPFWTCPLSRSVTISVYPSRIPHSYFAHVSRRGDAEGDVALGDTVPRILRVVVAFWDLTILYLNIFQGVQIELWWWSVVVRTIERDNVKLKEMIQFLCQILNFFLFFNNAIFSKSCRSEGRVSNSTICEFKVLLSLISGHWLSRNSSRVSIISAMISVTCPFT